MYLDTRETVLYARYINHFFFLNADDASEGEAEGQPCSARIRGNRLLEATKSRSWLYITAWARGLRPDAVTLWRLRVYVSLRRLHVDSYLIRTLNPCSPFPLPIPSERTKLLAVFMSSTGQATASPSNFQLVIDAALADYAKQTGTDLTKSPFAEKVERSGSPEAILKLLQEREKEFKEYRDVNRSLISCLSPAVKVFHAFSGIIGDAGSLVSVTYGDIPPFESFNVASSDPLLTSKGCVHEH
jgi:hypothetical protein